jgi:hypothetical protein
LKPTPKVSRRAATKKKHVSGKDLGNDKASNPASLAKLMRSYRDQEKEFPHLSPQRLLKKSVLTISIYKILRSKNSIPIIL